MDIDVASLFGFGATALGIYNTFSNKSTSLEHRLTKVETTQENEVRRLGRIEDKVDRIYEKTVGPLPVPTSSGK
jgi:hypothetical protein